jgi:membrane protease YdiL (CAAX protease family)
MPSGTSGGRTVAQVATPSHTALLVLALLIVSARGAMTRPMASWPASLSEPGERALLYAGIVGLQVSWTVYVWFGVRRAGGLRALIDQAPWTLARWVRYAAIGFAGFVFWLAFQGALGLVLRPTKEQLDGVAAMLPHKSGERLLWIGFALSAGMCEEVIYRGYLMRQFTAFSGHWQVGLLVQAAIYTCSHLVLPLPMVVAAALLGVLLGVIALWQKSLVPGMIIHTGTGLMPILASLASG